MAPIIFAPVPSPATHPPGRQKAHATSASPVPDPDGLPQDLVIMKPTERYYPATALRRMA